MNKYFLLLNILLINATTHSMMQHDSIHSQQLLTVVTQKPALYVEVNVQDLIMNYSATDAAKNDKTLCAYFTQLELNSATISDPILHKKIVAVLASNQYDQKLLEQALNEVRTQRNVKIKTLFHSRDQLTRAGKTADLCATMYLMRTYSFPTAPGIQVKITSVQETNTDQREDLDQSYSRAIAFSNQYGLIVPNGY